MRPLGSTRERTARPADWLGASNGALQHVATRGAAGTASPATALRAPEAPDKSAAPRRSWWRTALRLARDAAIGLTLISTIPLWHVSRRGDPTLEGITRLAERLDAVEPLRRYALPRDGTLTPQQAGVAYHELERVHGVPGFTIIPATAPLRRGWKGLERDDPRFAALRPPYAGLPDPRRIVEAAVRGLSADELAYLRTIAESPVWAALEPVVRAPAVDFLGARARLPFSDEASPLDMPQVAYSDARELADAGVARAAYYVAVGDRGRAEEALRLVISYGFTLIDHGSDRFDGMVGRIVVETGRYGLHDLQRLTGVQVGAALPPPSPAPPPLARPSAPRLSLAQSNARLLALVRDASRPRTLRLDALQELSLGTCRTVRGVLFGHSREIEEAFDEAERSLVRVHADAAYLALLREAPERPLPTSAQRWTPIYVPGAARVASVLTGNARFETCSLIDAEIR
jgi:hypothetical protein